MRPTPAETPPVDSARRRSGRKRGWLPALASIAAVVGLWVGPPPVVAYDYPGPRSLDGSGGVTRVLVGHFNDDAFVDLVANAPSTGRIAVHYGQGGGQFAGPVSWRVFAEVSALAEVDFDRDGRSDIAWVDAAGGRVGLMTQGIGVGAAFSFTSRAGLDEARDLVVFDENGDGWPDLLVAHEGADALSWYHNEAGSIGPPQSFAVGDGPSRLALLTHPAGPTVAALQKGYLSRDVLLFALPRPSPELRIPVEADFGLEAIDFDLDGDDELAVIEQSPPRLRWFDGQGDAFVPVGELPIAPGSTSVGVFPEDLSPRRLLVAEQERHRITLWTDDGFGFTRTGSWYVGARIPDLVIEDIDADGASEVVVPRPDANQISIVEALGDGFLAPWAIDTGTDPLRLERFSEPGQPEVFAALCPGSSEVWLYRIEAGQVLPWEILAADPDAREIVLADLDGQNGADVVTASLSAGIWVHRAASGGGFLPTEVFSFGSAPIDVEVADVVGDSALDLIVADRDLPGLRIYAGDGAGGFAEVDQVETLQIPAGVVARDLDLNGYADLVVLGETDVIYLVFNSPGSALVAVPLTVGDTPRDIAFGDFNEDVYPDMIVANAGSSSYAMVMSVLPAFYAVIDRERPTPFGAQNVEVIDIDADGLDDVLLSSPSFRSVALHRNGGVPGRPSEPIVLSLTIPVSDDPRDLRLAYVDGDSIPDILTITLSGDVLFVHRSDPYDASVPSGATVSAVRQGSTVRIDVHSDARWGHDLQLVRATDGGRLALAAVEPGHWRAVDAALGAGSSEYVVRDRRGTALAHTTVDAQERATTVGDDAVQWLDPVVRGRSAEFRMRAPRGARPDLRIFDVRGRRVARPTVTEEGDGWYRASWSGTDLRGRPISRGRYLVRVTMGGQVFRGSVLIR